MGYKWGETHALFMPFSPGTLRSSTCALVLPRVLQRLPAALSVSFELRSQTTSTLYTGPSDVSQVSKRLWEASYPHTNFPFVSQVLGAKLRVE